MWAAAPFRVGETVGIAGGVVMTEEQFHAYVRTVARWNATQIGETLHLVDVIQAPDLSGGFINHACDSNLWLAVEVTLTARRDIAADEELTLDYALTTVEPCWRLERPCRCGSPLCRQTITGNDWRLPDVRARYSGHFASFINARIEAEA